MEEHFNSFNSRLPFLGLFARGFFCLKGTMGKIFPGTCLRGLDQYPERDETSGS